MVLLNKVQYKPQEGISLVAHTGPWDHRIASESSSLTSHSVHLSKQEADSIRKVQGD